MCSTTWINTASERSATPSSSLLTCYSVATPNSERSATTLTLTPTHEPERSIFANAPLNPRGRPGDIGCIPVPLVPASVSASASVLACQLPRRYSAAISGKCVAWLATSRRILELVISGIYYAIVPLPASADDGSKAPSVPGWRQRLSWLAPLRSPASSSVSLLEQTSAVPEPVWRWVEPMDTAGRAAVRLCCEASSMRAFRPPPRRSMPGTGCSSSSPSVPSPDSSPTNRSPRSNDDHRTSLSPRHHVQRLSRTDPSPGHLDLRPTLPDSATIFDTRGRVKVSGTVDGPRPR